MILIRRIDLRSEDGIALVVAVVLMVLMLSLGLGAVAFVDGQSNLTAQQRQRETAFNVAEAALNAQVTQLSDHWAGTNGYTDPTVAFTQCPGGLYCPSSGELTSLIPSADAKTPITWQTNVYDDSDGLESFFSDSRINRQCGCDLNGDGKVWVRSQATVRNKTRAIVSLVQEQTQAESVPHAAIIAGSLTIDNNGLHNNPIIDANGGILAVRCSAPGSTSDGSAFQSTETTATTCMGQPAGVSPTQTPSDWNQLLSNQISGFSTRQENYAVASVFTQDQIYRFINTARAESTYYTSCPSSLAGAVVVINTTGDCTYTGNDVWNTQSDPGFLILLNAGSTLTLAGTTQYFGIIYHANEGAPPTLGSATQSSGTLVTVTSNAQVVGGVIVDGPGRVNAGQSGALNIKFDDHGYDAVRSLAAAGIIQNSWREIQPGA